MRFVRRYRTRSLWGRGRRAASPPPESAPGPVAAEERNALLHPGAREADAPSFPEPETTTSGDPTQRLLTTLGRFQRYVARAAAGIEQEEWADNCMDELVAALDISLEQNWSEVVESLAGTGRVLQSYGEPGYAHLCVPFLMDSYDILCLMVGDLIVSEVRPSVTQKWRERYGRAVAELEAAGLTLMEDEEEPSVGAAYVFAPVPPQIHKMETETAQRSGPELEEETESEREAAAPAAHPREDARDTEPWTERGAPPEDASDQTEAALRAEISLDASLGEWGDAEAGTPVAGPATAVAEDVVAGKGDDVDETAVRYSEYGMLLVESEEDGGAEALRAPESSEAGDDAAMEKVGVAGYVEDTGPEAIELEESVEEEGAAASVAIPDDMAETGEAEEPEDEESVEPVPSAEMGPDESGESDAASVEACDKRTGPVEFEGSDEEEDLGIDPEVVSALDRLCDALILFEDVADGGPLRAASAVREQVAALDTYARRKGRGDSAALCQTMLRLCDLAQDPAHAKEDRFLELAYGFCETYVVANTEPGNAMVAAWRGEGEALLDAWRRKGAPAAVSTPGSQVQPRPAPFVGTGDDRPLRMLLQRAQRAVADGNVADAKELALEAAATLTKVEVAKSESAVHEVEVRLKEANDEVERAREATRQAEQRVAEVVQCTTECKRAGDAARVRAARVLDMRKEVEKRIAQLDARIRELQMQREGEVKRMFEAGIELDAAKQKQYVAERELAEQAEAERAAREIQENARQHIKGLLRKRSELELTLGQARETLTRHRASLVDLEQAVAEMRAGKEETDSEGLLF